MSLSLFSKPDYDVIIIGGGPAGLTAGIYSASLGLKTLILEGKFSPRLKLIKKLYNYPGFPEGISGIELYERMRRQAEKFGVEFKRDNAINLVLNGPIKTITTTYETLTSKVVIICIGLKRFKPILEGEDKYIGIGVSYCTVCDGPLFRNRDVCVIGEGEIAIRDAIFLSAIARKTYFIPLKKLDSKSIGKLSDKNVEIIYAKPIKVLGENFVKGLKIVKDDMEELLKVSGIFIIREDVPLSELLKKSGLELDKDRCIKVNRWQETNIKGVYAAGDCTCGGMQVITAAGEGAMAAIRAAVYIRSMKKTQSLMINI